MTRVARDAVARQRAIFAVRVVRQSENHAVFERLVPIKLYLSLAHHAMTAVASVVEEYRARGIQRFFGFELGVKDWIASGQAHHRCSPLSVRRKINRLLIRFAKRIEHVIVRGGVTAHALAGSKEAIRAARTWNDVIETFSGKLQYLLRGNIGHPLE